MAPQIISLEQASRFANETYSTDTPIEVIIKYHGDLEPVAAELGGFVEILDADYAILTLPLGNLSNIFNYPQIEYFELPKNISFILRNNLNSACITPVQRESGLGLTGAGTVIGIIDSGIDYTHPDFISPDGTSRILYLWDQNINGRPPEGFIYGTVYTQDEITAAINSPNPFEIVPSRDDVGHGTAVAGVAAGNGGRGVGIDKGVAPEASLIIVKLSTGENPSFSKTTDIMRGVKFVVDTAERLGMPVAVNISYGTNDGPHDGNTLFERYLNSVCDQWKNVICVAAGNEGASGHHYQGLAKQGETISAEISIGEKIKRFYISIWKNFADTILFSLVAPSGRSTGNILPTLSVTRLTLDNVQISILYRQPNQYTISQEIFIQLTSLGDSIAEGLWRLNAFGGQIVDGTFNVWLPTTDVVTTRTAFLQPEVENTITIPATANNVISVGGYNSNINTSAEFSGRGKPYLVFGQKPDLVAPAVFVYTTKSGGGYDNFSGTSLAAPFVTGSAALMMQWGIVKGNDPFLYGQRVKAFLCRNASREFQVSYPNSIWGYGTLNLCDTMEDVIIFNQTGGAFQ